MGDAGRGGGTVAITLFGRFEVRIAGELLSLRRRKSQWLLALLALRHGREVERSWLAATLWPEAPESHAFFYLRRTLSELRQLLGTEACRLLAPTPHTLRLDLSG